MVAYDCDTSLQCGQRLHTLCPVGVNNCKCKCHDRAGNEFLGMIAMVRSNAPGRVAKGESA